MGQRLQLQSLLEGLIQSGNVYFQPPASVQMKYPCIVYQRDLADTKFADNKPYSYEVRYQVTVIDRSPDSDIPRKVASLPKCIFNRFYVADNLNHDVFNLYY
jgi:hypothetical protein